jgi:hypothetical protein
MSVAQMRPTFSLETGLSREDIMNCLRRSVEHCPNEYLGQFKRDHALISIEQSKRHFWSPWMHLEIRSDHEAGEQLQVFGRFSPHPSIWTGFMFSYLSIGVLVFFGLMLGVSQQLSGQTPWGYYCIPGLLAVAFLLWLASKMGQKLAFDEMRRMKAQIEHCLETETETETEAVATAQA